MKLWCFDWEQVAPQAHGTQLLSFCLFLFLCFLLIARADCSPRWGHMCVQKHSKVPFSGLVRSAKELHQARVVHELSVTSVHLQKKRRSWHPKVPGEATVRNISKKMLLKIAYFYCQTQNSYNYSAQNTFFFAYFTHLEHGTPTFFSWSFFPRQKLRRKKSAATTKIPSVRHFQNLKSAFWEAYMGKSLRRRRIFFFWGGDFFFSPHPKT